MNCACVLENDYYLDADVGLLCSRAHDWGRRRRTGGKAFGCCSWRPTKTPPFNPSIHPLLAKPTLERLRFSQKSMISSIILSLFLSRFGVQGPHPVSSLSSFLSWVYFIPPLSVRLRRLARTPSIMSSAAARSGTRQCKFLDCRCPPFNGLYRVRYM